MVSELFSKFKWDHFRRRYGVWTEAYDFRAVIQVSRATKAFDRLEVQVLSRWVLPYQAYLPGSGDTMIHKVVLPGRDPYIALSLG